MVARAGRGSGESETFIDVEASFLMEKTVFCELEISFPRRKGGTVLGERTQRDSSPAEAEPGLAPRVAAFCCPPNPP